jgi:hypothetical protein
MDSAERQAEAQTPSFFEYLSRSDQEAYRSLQTRLSSSDNRYKRHKRLDILQRLLDEIRDFCIRGDDRDSSRSIVCGVCWLTTDRIATNIRQLQVLLNKSKSSINGSLAKLPYAIIPTRGEDWDQLILHLPRIGRNYAEQREWTIRVKVEIQDEMPEPPNFGPDSAIPGENGSENVCFDRFEWEEEYEALYAGWGPGERCEFTQPVRGKYLAYCPGSCSGCACK